VNLTTKRILILFSIFLNIGFVAAAGHHALFYNPHEQGHEVAVQELEKLDVPEAKRQILVDIEAAFHKDMDEFFARKGELMDRRLDVVTGSEPPNQAELDELKAQQLILMGGFIDRATDMVLQIRQEIGPELTREYIENIRARRHKARH